MLSCVSLRCLASVRKSVPILSSSAVHIVSQLNARSHTLPTVDVSFDEIVEDEHIEDLYLNLHLKDDGTVSEATQIDDYMFRDSRLDHVCFYDFVRCIIKRKKKEHSGRETLARYSLRQPHPDSETHELTMT